MKKDIKSIVLEDLEFDFSKISLKSYKALQVFKWMHKGIRSFEEMTDISKDLRSYLEENYKIPKIQILKKLESKKDATVKYLFKFEDGETVESVLMEYKHGNTVCISTQAGCKMGCDFCATGKLGFSRNLTPAEMILQIEEASLESGRKISNIVLMGMGEPLDNYENVLKFSKIASHQKGLNIGARHISLSTCGIVDKIYKLADLRPQFTLSISLHASTDEVRNKIMKINKRWNIEELIKACKYYSEKTNRRISFEYAMISGINDSEADAKNLSKLLSDNIERSLCHVNLIPVNNIDEGFIPSSYNKMDMFLNILQKNGIAATVRRTLGQDINASCGQLRGQQ